MPDIAMCLENECPLRGACYRAVPDEHWQSYILREVHSCRDYMPIEDQRVRTMEEIENE